MLRELYGIWLRAVWMCFLVFHFSFWCSYFSSLANRSLRFFVKVVSAAWEISFFSLSLTVFGGWIGNLCKNCFVGGDFAVLGGVVCVGVIYPMCLFAWTTSFDFSLFLTRWVSVCWNSAKLGFFRCSWNFNQSLGSNYPIFPWELYICSLNCCMEGGYN